MRTGCSLTICCSLLPGGVGVPGPGRVGAWSAGRVPGPWEGVPGLGGVWSRGSAPGGVPGLGGAWSRGRRWGGAWSGGLVPGPGGCLLLGGMCVWSRGGIPACTKADTLPPPVDRHMLVKTLPWPNFVAAGNNRQRIIQQSHRAITSLTIAIIFAAQGSTSFRLLLWSWTKLMRSSCVRVIFSVSFFFT